MRAISLIATAAMFAALTGCEDRAAKEQQKANQAQAEADKKINEANNQSVTKTTSAQLEADQKIAEAQSKFMKIREDYRHDVTATYNDLTQKIDKLEAKSTAQKGKVKSDIDASLTDIHAKRDAFLANFNSLENESAATWDNAKARADKSLDDLKAALKKAPSAN